ncbi:MFS transporter, partial [Streptomyces scabiei]
ATVATVLVPALGLPFATAPLLAAAFVLGLTTQGAKIATDTVVQSSVDDTFRGRIFSVYDVLFNVAFVGAAGVAALMLPPDGRSVPLVMTVSVIYGVVAAAMARFESRRVSHQ